MPMKHVARKTRNDFIMGRGLIHRKPEIGHFMGKGLIDKLLPAAMNFARNTESAANVGRSAVDLINTISKFRDVKKAADEIKQHDADAKKAQQLLQQIKKGSGFRKI